MPHLSFADELEKLTGTAVSECFQCFRCTNGCPVARDMDIVPHKIMAHIAYGQRERVLSCQALWSCLQCVTCSIRCPNGIDVARVFETLKSLAIKSGLACRTDIYQMDAAMIDTVSRYGRLHELGAVMRYRMGHGGLFKGIPMSFDMLKRRRIGIFPHMIAERKRLASIIGKKVKNNR